MCILMHLLWAMLKISLDPQCNSVNNSQVSTVSFVVSKQPFKTMENYKTLGANKEKRLFLVGIVHYVTETLYKQIIKGWNCGGNEPWRCANHNEVNMIPGPIYRDDLNK